MLQISEDLILRDILLEDQSDLFHLMSKIYPPVYAHYWPDIGARYLESLYSFENLKLELENPNSRYYFIQYQKVNIGILKILMNEKLEGYTPENTVKLHRIYLDSNQHRKGFGRMIMIWMVAHLKAQQKSVLWLEAMDTQDSAIDFYKSMGFKIVEKFQFPSNFMVENRRGMFKMVKEI